MKRREVIALFAGATFAAPFVAHAQNTNKAPRRITFLPDLHPATLEAWRAEIRVLGWIEGQDFVIMQSGKELGSRGSLDEAAQRVVEDNPNLVRYHNRLRARSATRNGVNSYCDAGFWIPGRGWRG